MGTGFLSWGYRSHIMTLAIHVHQVPRLRQTEAISLPPNTTTNIYAFIAHTT